MKTPFFYTQDRILRLNLSVAKWKGTPWRPNSMAAGVGVSCHNLPRAIYHEAHFADLPEIVSTPAEATANNQMENFLDACPHFERVGTEDRGLPGDLLGLFIPMDSVGKRIRQRVVNHLGVLLPENWFVHTLMKKNTDVDLISVSPWQQILVARWRPVERE